MCIVQNHDDTTVVVMITEGDHEHRSPEVAKERGINAAGLQRRCGYKDHESFTRIMCWSHVHRNLLSKANSIDSEPDKKRIIIDIERLQVMPSPEMFNHAVKLFFDKWSKSNDNNISNFLNHFKAEWIESTNSGWYEGVADSIPSTDNGLESTNAKIKRHHTLGERMSVADYLKNAMEMMYHWSHDRTLGLKQISVAKEFLDSPSIEGEIWKRAWAYLYKEDPLIRQLGKTISYVLTKVKHKHLIDENFIKNKFNSMKNSFDEFVLKVSKVRLVQLDASKWENSKCTCTAYLKNYICFHIAALAVSRKMTHIPIAYKAQPIGIKPKRGRPSKAASAFVKQ